MIIPKEELKMYIFSTLSSYSIKVYFYPVHYKVLLRSLPNIEPYVFASKENKFESFDDKLNKFITASTVKYKKYIPLHNIEVKIQ